MPAAAEPERAAALSERARLRCLARYAESRADRYRLTQEAFANVVAAVIQKYAAEAGEPEVLALIDSLKVEELALARGCALGNEAAWEVFLTRYRASLYGAAYSIAKDEATGRELADSLYADLYGLPADGRARVSKLSYYMGRGSLEGWLRTVLAQEYINRYRSAKKTVSLEEQIEEGLQLHAPMAESSAPTSDAEQAAGEVLRCLSAEDRVLLASYYLDGRNLAEIAKVLRVHESTISRKLDRLASALRRDIRACLIRRGLSPRQADEAMQELDVRDVTLNVREALQFPETSKQGTDSGAFYKQSPE
jgi:RNA polymerase sigma-70 factor, ECF subfamily